MQHSLYTAKAAEIIAAHHPALDAEAAYVLGCLHDIGRREGVTDLRHTLDGYTFLQSQGFDDAARICLTHSFPSLRAETGAGEWDCTEQEYRFVQAYLSRLEIDEYDRLIQLCDALALPTGFCLLEKRFVDVALRRGINEHTLPRWRAFLDLFAYFQERIGQSIYPLLPGIVDSTFSTNNLKR